MGKISQLRLKGRPAQNWREDGISQEELRALIGSRSGACGTRDFVDTPPKRRRGGRNHSKKTI